VRRTSRITGLERTEPEVGGLAVGHALAVATTAALSARETAGRRETAGTAAALMMVLRFVVLRPVMVLGFVLLFVVVVMVVMVLGFVRPLVTTENSEKRTGRSDGPDGRGVDCFHGHRSARGFLHHLSGHKLSVFCNVNDAYATM